MSNGADELQYQFLGEGDPEIPESFSHQERPNARVRLDEGELPDAGV